MSKTKFILGLFDDPDDMMHGIEKLQKSSVPIYDVYTPMPIHGIEDKLGVKESRLGYAAFCFGCLGASVIFSIVYYTLVHDWPMNVGGKPSFAIPNFVPFTFEWTILFTAFGMTFTFFAATHLFPGRAPRVMDLRATDDRFVIAINAKGNIPHDEITNLLKEAGAVEVKHNDRNMLAMNKFRILGTTAIVIAASLVITSCKDKRSTGWEYAPNMYEHTAYDPDQPNPNFKDGKTAQVPPAGTIPIGFKRFDYPNTKEGYEKASLEVTSLISQTPNHLAEGKKLFTTFCSPCHGVTGQGDGLVVQHGYPPPPSYSKGQSSRGGAMKDLTDGKIYHTITYGVNAMGSYASQIAPEDRWKIVMYVHHLQNL